MQHIYQAFTLIRRKCILLVDLVSENIDKRHFSKQLLDWSVSLSCIYLSICMSVCEGVCVYMYIRVCVRVCVSVCVRVIVVVGYCLTLSCLCCHLFYQLPSCVTM